MFSEVPSGFRSSAANHRVSQVFFDEQGRPRWSPNPTPGRLHVSENLCVCVFICVFTRKLLAAERSQGWVRLRLLSADDGDGRATCVGYVGNGLWCDAKTQDSVRKSRVVHVTSSILINDRLEFEMEPAVWSTVQKRGVDEQRRLSIMRPPLLCRSFWVASLSPSGCLQTQERWVLHSTPKSILSANSILVPFTATPFADGLVLRNKYQYSSRVFTVQIHIVLEMSHFI